MEDTKNYGVHRMKNKELMTKKLETAEMMYYSRELVHLKVPKEINYLIYTIGTIFVAVLILCFAVKINDVVKVRGWVRAKENNSEVRNVLSGTITQINYEPNQFVKAGDVLLCLDDSQYKNIIGIQKAEEKKLEEELYCANALKDAMESGKNNFKDEIYASAKINEYLKTVSYLKKQINIAKYKYDYEEKLPETMKNYRYVKEASMEYNLKLSELEKFKADTKADTEEKIKNLSVELEKLQQEIKKTEKEYSFLKIKAPVSGYIQETSSLNCGDYISAGQNLVNIIPTDANDFKVELAIPTKDIGEITEGMKVKFRLSAFPFFEYKGAEGNIFAIDPDIRKNEGNQYVYCVYSDIDKISFKSSEGKVFPLRSGIEVDGRIILDRISIAAYLLRKVGFVR